MAKPLPDFHDTIAAISSPLGRGGIGIVRMSGPQALPIADQIFHGKKGAKPSTVKSHTIHYGNIVDFRANPAEVLDEVLLNVMRSPKTYTCEDIVEINCHGGQVALQAVLQLVLDRGARLAEPGEFTKRAFLNGRIDLTQAEAVLDIIGSKTEAFLRVSTHQLKGELTTELESIRAELMNIYTECEAVVNFPEEGVHDISTEGMLNALQRIHQRIQKLLATSEQGKLLKEGIKVVIAGKPNVGKSSLLNVLLKTPRAIVTEIAGTTRDTIEETAQIQGIPFQLVDTAGILTPRDLIEQEAVRRSHLSIAGADLILFVLDGSQKISPQDRAMAELVKDRPVIVVVNKIDLPQQIEEDHLLPLCPGRPVVRISSITKTGLEDLEAFLVHQVLHDRPVETSGVLLSNLRHIQALKKSLAAVKKAEGLFRQRISVEFVSEEMMLAIKHLDEITGRDIDLDLLDKIFAEFCIGK